MSFTRKLSRAQVALAAIVAVLSVSSISPCYGRADARVFAGAKTCEPKARALLQQLVEIDSGTSDVAGVAAIGAILRIELESLGANCSSGLLSLTQRSRRICLALPCTKFYTVVYSISYRGKEFSYDDSFTWIRFRSAAWPPAPRLGT